MIASTVTMSVSKNHMAVKPRCQNSRLVLHRLHRFALKRTWTIPLILLVIFFCLYILNPTESNVIHRFIFLSYELPLNLNAGDATASPRQYGKGPRDIAFVSFYMILLSFTREFIMQELLRPLARYCGLRSRAKQGRFMEQMYTAVYFSVMGPAGLYVLSQSPVWYFNTRGMYEGFPHKTHEAAFKFYYLFQAAYWAQQAVILVLGVEKRRKDFKELIAHHVVTLALIGGSYRFHFTYMGIAVYVTHDISDFFLATVKSLNYIGSSIQEPYFALNICVWIYLRHYINLRILYSLFNEFKTVGPYGINWETEQYKGTLSNVIALVLLSTLQVLNLFWLYCLFRSAYRIVVYKIAKDDRSDAEDSETEESDKTIEMNAISKVELVGVKLPNDHADAAFFASGSKIAARQQSRSRAKAR